MASPVRVHQPSVAQSVLIVIAFELAVASDAHTHFHHLQACIGSAHFPFTSLSIVSPRLLSSRPPYGALVFYLSPQPFLLSPTYSFLIAGISAILLGAMQTILSAPASADSVCTLLRLACPALPLIPVYTTFTITFPLARWLRILCEAFRASSKEYSESMTGFSLPSSIHCVICLSESASLSRLLMINCNGTGGAPRKEGTNLAYSICRPD